MVNLVDLGSGVHRAPAGEDTSDSKIAEAVVLKDILALTSRKTMLISGIGYVAGLAIPANFTEAESITSYRFKPSADMRAVEDAANVPQAEAWLNTGAADVADSDLDQNHYIVPAGEWSEWQEFPQGTFLTNVYFSLDAAGTGQTVQLEAE